MCVTPCQYTPNFHLLAGDTKGESWVFVGLKLSGKASVGCVLDFNFLGRYQFLSGIRGVKMWPAIPAD